MPQLFSGFYLTGEGQAGMYHPLHQLLYRLLPLQRAIDCEYLLNYPFMLAGTWLFLRRRIPSRSAAMLGGVIFTFSGYNLLHFIHPNAVAIVAHIPWLLWTIDIVLTDSRRLKVYSALAAMALLTGSQLLLGYPQFVWFSLLTEFAYTVYVLIDRRNVPRALCRPGPFCRKCVGCHVSTWPDLVLAKFIGLFLGGAQLLPTIDALIHSSRQAADAAFASAGSLHPLNLLQLAAPYLFVNRVVGGNTHELGLYLGAVPLMLIVWLIIRGRDLGILRSLAAAAGLFGALALLLAFGEYGRIHQLLAYLPPLRYFRFPARYSGHFSIGGRRVGGIGIPFTRAHQPRRAPPKTRGSGLPRRRICAAYVMAPIACRSGYWQLISAAAAVLGIALGNQPYIAPLPLVLVGPALFITAVFLIYWAARGSFAALVGLILLAALDLGIYGLSYSVYPYCPKMDDYIAKVPTPPRTGQRPHAGLFVRLRRAGAAHGRSNRAPRLEPGRRLCRPGTPTPAGLQNPSRLARRRGPLGPARTNNQRYPRAYSPR